MELELTLDGNGRTSFDKEKMVLMNDNETTTKSATTTQRRKIDYSSKTVMTNLSPTCSSNTQQHHEQEQSMDELLYDCEIADCALLPRTFWVPAAGAASNETRNTQETAFVPRSKLEQMAMQVFQYHTSGILYDPQTSGAEWWVQLRPSPPGIGRYAVLEEQEGKEKNREMNKKKASSSQQQQQQDISKSGGISFHWDKDEELRLLMGGTMFIHPHLSTVTYITDLGAPTMALNCRVNSLTGEWIPLCEQPSKEEETQKQQDYDRKDKGDQDEDTKESAGGGVQAYVSWPKQGKHLSFDGRFLHAAPSDLMKPGQFQQQCQFETKEIEKDATTLHEQKQKQKRRHRRVTFLVNIWLNYKPMDVHEFPESMLDKLSPREPFFQLFPLSSRTNASTTTSTLTKTTSVLKGNEEKEKKEDARSSFMTTQALPCRKVVVQSSKGTIINCSEQGKDVSTTPLTSMTWPLGGCETSETLTAEVPLDIIQQESDHGGNVLIEWKQSTTASTDPQQTSSNGSICHHNNVFGVTLSNETTATALPTPTNNENDTEDANINKERDGYCVERQPKKAKQV